MTSGYTEEKDCFGHPKRNGDRGAYRQHELIWQRYREELFCSPPFPQDIAVGLACGDDAFFPLSKRSQVSFPRVLSLFKMRTQCSDTTLSLVRAVLGTDETLDC